MGKKTSKSGVGAKASAKIKVVAKATATFQRKKEITEIIPPDVTRAKASAWLDLISPITEWAGLKGDQIRHKRELLRIQREDVLTTIMLRARQRLDELGDSIKPIPNKFVVPFLEKASLEDPNSDLIDAWVGLLTSAATDFNPHMVRFCSILSEIGKTEVQFLHRLCREARNSRRNLNAIEDAPMQFSTTDLVRRFNSTIETSESLQKNFENIIERHEMPGGLVMIFGIDDRTTGGSFDRSHDLDDSIWDSSVSLLQSLGLVENNMFISGEVHHYSWYAESVSLTSFGVAFVSACDPEVRDAFRQAAIRFQQAMERRRS